MNPVRVTVDGLGAPQSYEISAAAGLALVWQLEKALERQTGCVRRATPATCPDCKGAGVLYDDVTGRGDFVAEPCARCAKGAA